MMMNGCLNFLFYIKESMSWQFHLQLGTGLRSFKVFHWNQTSPFYSLIDLETLNRKHPT